MNPIRIMITFNNQHVRDGLATYLGAQENIEVVAEISSGLELVRKYVELKPDIVLMDLLLPGVNGIEIMKALQEYAPDVIVILITNSRGIHLQEAAHAAGAARLLNKGIPGEELLKTIHEVMIEQKDCT